MDSASDSLPGISGGSGLAVSRIWESEILSKIASRLATMSVDDMNALFGIFAKSDRYITKENFKITVMRTLRLKIDEQELDMMLKTNTIVGEKDVIDATDFKALLQGPLAAAKRERESKSFEMKKMQMSFHGGAGMGTLDPEFARASMNNMSFSNNVGPEGGNVFQ
jgi:hypothetical protein